jgi:hypothetical protein
MNITPLDNFYLQQSESLKSCYLALRDIILAQSEQITPEWKYGCPFFLLQRKDVLLPVVSQKIPTTLYSHYEGQSNT